MATQAEAAAHLFISAARFRDLVDAGVISRQPPSTYNLETVRKEALEHLRAQAAGRGVNTSLAAERVALARSKRELSELQVGELKGELVRVDVVCDALVDRFVRVRERLLGVPAKLADQLMQPREGTRLPRSCAPKFMRR
jgi:hypothetical protein